MTNTKTNDAINKQLILTALEKDIKLHVKLTDGVWRNGFVKEIEADFFMLDDAVNGMTPIFYIQLQKVEPYMEEGA